MRERVKFRRKFILSMFIFALLGCCPMDYCLLHLLQSLPEICRESAIFDRGRVRIHWIAYYPDKEVRVPAILVHPDAGGLAEDMEGICLALARAGYFAAAVHYQRLENLENKNPLFPWKSPQEITVALGHLKRHPRVNSARIGLLGYSKGGMLSLLIAAHDADIQAVVAYYPLADFEEWLDLDRYYFPKSLFFWGIRRYFMKELKASTWEEALIIMRAASPINYVERIQAPVLLIHGEKDRTAPLEQVQRLCDQLRAAGTKCEFFIVPQAGHVFNFRNEEQGKVAWGKTIGFLDGRLK